MSNGIDNSGPQVNPQIVDAVKQANYGAFGRIEGTPDQKINVGNEIAKQKVAQATALAIQDATDYQRNMMSILTTVQSKAFAMMFSDTAQIPTYIAISTQAATVMEQVTKTFSDVGDKAAEIISKYPSK